MFAVPFEGIVSFPSTIFESYTPTKLALLFFYLSLQIIILVYHKTGKQLSSHLIPLVRTDAPSQICK
jgi:hypothetical protein